MKRSQDRLRPSNSSTTAIDAIEPQKNDQNITVKNKAGKVLLVIDRETGAIDYVQSLFVDESLIAKIGGFEGVITDYLNVGPGTFFGWDEERKQFCCFLGEKKNEVGVTILCKDGIVEANKMRLKSGDVDEKFEGVGARIASHQGWLEAHNSALDKVNADVGKCQRKDDVWDTILIHMIDDADRGYKALRDVFGGVKTFNLKHSGKISDWDKLKVTSAAASYTRFINKIDVYVTLEMKAEGQGSVDYLLDLDLKLEDPIPGRKQQLGPGDVFLDGAFINSNNVLGVRGTIVTSGNGVHVQAKERRINGVTKCHITWSYKV